MSRHLLLYATVNDGRGFFWDYDNFCRLAALDPGVPRVEMFIVAREDRPACESDFRDLGKLCRLAAGNPRVRVRRITFRPDDAMDFDAWRYGVSGIVEECAPDDYLLCLDRRAFGPLGDGWYAGMIRRMERPGGGAQADLTALAAAEHPDAAVLRERAYCIFGRVQALARVFNGPAEPSAVSDASNATDQAHGPAPFRRWARDDSRSPARYLQCLVWQLTPARFRHGADPWSEWLVDLHDLYYLGLEAEIPGSRIHGVAPEPRGGDLSPLASRIGVHLHLHYPELWPEIRASLAVLPPGFGLHVTVTWENAALSESIAAEFPGAKVRQVPNRGRDMGPFMALLSEGTFDHYDYVCKLHSKKSPRRGRETYLGRTWRRRAFADLLGTTAQVGRILSLFESDPGLGLVGSTALRMPNLRGHPKDFGGDNRTAVEALLTRCAGRKVSPTPDFFAGSMFWFRPRALQALRALAIAPEDFPEEPCAQDGTLAHALERAVPMTASLAGYRIADITLEPAGGRAMAFAAPARKEESLHG